MCSREAAATAPATVSNVCCGFDVLGFALEAPADIVTARKTAAAGVSVAGISGDGGRLPRDPERNTAAVGLDASPDQLLWSAMQGERAAAGSPHPDNVAPSLLGGFVLARSSDPPDLVRLPVPRGLACVVLHPALEVETSAARAILPASVPLADAVRQWANVGALVAALYSGDLDLLGRAMVDHIVEPRRAHLVPGFAAVVRAARDAGAIGSGLSGAGPSIFALCRSRDDAHRAGGAMLAALRRDGGVEGTLYVSPVATSGARLVDAVV